jgi:hypothetical protein
MATFDNIVGNSTNFKGYTGNPPTTEAEYLALDCWKDTSLAPTWASIATEMAVLEVQENRRPEYPAIGDQLDALFHAGVFPAEMAAEIQAVKDKYPKA